MYDNIELVELDELSDEHLKDQMERELSRPFMTNESALWRMLLLTSNSASESDKYVLLMSAAHVLADGRSVLLALLDYLTILSAVLCGEKCAEMEEAPVLADFDFEKLMTEVEDRAALGSCSKPPVERFPSFLGDPNGSENKIEVGDFDLSKKANPCHYTGFSNNISIYPES